VLFFFLKKFSATKKLKKGDGPLFLKKWGQAPFLMFRLVPVLFHNEMGPDPIFLAPFF
jgi:hypothetical protein